MPCEAVAGQPRYFFGEPFQHALAPMLADKFINSTAVANWTRACYRPEKRDRQAAA